MLKHFQPEAILFRQGDPSEYVILIRSGSAEVLRESGDDAIVLGTVQAGEFVGEHVEIVTGENVVLAIRPRPERFSRCHRVSRCR